MGDDLFGIGLDDWMGVNRRFSLLVTFLEELDTATEALIDRQRRVVAEQTNDADVDIEMFEKDLPRTLRYSTILPLYAALDTLLARLCGFVKRRTAANFFVSDMASPRQLATRLKYVKTALGRRLPEGSLEHGFGQKLSAFS